MPLERIFELAKLSPEKPAVIAGPNVVSYGRFARFIATTRDHLVRRGVEAGGRLLDAPTHGKGGA